MASSRRQSRQYRCTRGLEVQTLLFPRSATWSSTRARAWARRHGFSSSKVDTTSQYFRVRNRNPNAFVRGSFRTIVLSDKDGVNAVVGCPLPGRESDRTHSTNGRRPTARDPDVRVGDVYDEFGHEWLVTKIRGRDVYVEREDRDAFGKNVPERRIFNVSAFRSLRKIKSGPERARRSRDESAPQGFRFEALYAGDDRWRSAGGEIFPSMSAALMHAERTVRSKHFDAERARIVAPNGRTVWTHYPTLTRRSSSRDTNAERVVSDLRANGYDAVVIHDPDRKSRGRARRRDVSRYDLSPAGREWMRAYRAEGATPEVRRGFERLSNFDKAAARFLLSEDNGPPSGDRSKNPPRRPRRDPIDRREASEERAWRSARPSHRRRFFQGEREILYRGRWENLSSLAESQLRAFEAEEDETRDTRRDVLSTRKREKLRRSQFALPKRRALPIHNAAHARNAAARLEQMRKRGTVSRAEYAKAHRAILRAERRFGIQSRSERRR